MNTGAADDEAGADQSEVAPTSHRRPGPASIRVPTDPVTFNEVLRDNPREVLVVAFGVVLGLVWGGRAVAIGDVPAERILGMTAVAAAILLLASYALRFRRPLLDRPAWSQSRKRKVVRFALVYAWGVYFTVAVVASLAGLAWKWWT